MLANDPDLKKAYDIAWKWSATRTWTKLLTRGYDELNSLDVDGLYSRSGRTRHGYVALHDEAWERFEEAISPFINEMKQIEIVN